MAAVRIEEQAFNDVRYDRLAAICGLADADHARGKMARLWRQCTQEQRYILPVEDVIAVLGPNAEKGLTDARLGRTMASGIRIAGTRGRIEWLKKLRENGAKGGRPPKTKRLPSGSGDGNPSSPASVPVTTQKTKDRRLPTLDEVRDYFARRGKGLDPEKFFAHYEANGWVQSNGRQIKKWQAAVITWEKNEAAFAARRNGQSKRPHNREDELLAELRHAEGAP